MPYKKKAYKRKPSRPGYVSCGKMVYSDAAKALAMAKYLKSVVNVEYKNFDTQTLASGINQTPAIVQLTNIAQGDTTITRDGASIKIVSIRFVYNITANASAPVTHIRVMVVCDKQTNQAIYTAGDLLQDATPNDALISPRNLNNSRRFNVLYDKTHVFSNSGRNGGHFEFHKKLQLKIRYDASTPSIADLTEVSLSLLLVSNQQTNFPSMDHSTRLRYVDN